MGVVATHDIALSELSSELPNHARNVHFTDVFEGGEMLFDYKLREGVVKTSNALRLLKMAGIDVEVDDALA
jgi:DNA mismatch repair ATPase MutS